MDNCQAMGLCTAAVFLPLVAGGGVGLFARTLSPRLASLFTCWAMGLACLSAMYLLIRVFETPQFSLQGTWYHWGTVGDLSLAVGFLLDRLSIMMMVTVLSVSFLVHVYSMGYLHADPGYARFFAYLSLFTFAMLMLVVANNFLQLFFGWEAVGLMSYLLIGFWFKRESANLASVKAFVVNRVGDVGLLLGVATVAWFFGSLDYQTVFEKMASHQGHPLIQIGGTNWSVFTVITACLWIGAMAKSAQIPLHIWLPDSMEGPTPVSALIHAATMVTAGIFMVARLSPLFEQSEAVLNSILMIGSVTAVLTGLMGVVQNDIKRIIAYSTLSQLGYMAVGLGASAYAFSIFHLMTHAFFKALLFLGAGSVILAMHHEQDIWKMGGLRKQLPFTHAAMLLGSLSLVGIPPFSGFFSKELLIEAVHHCALPAAKGAYWALVLSVFVTALYSFRLLCVVFYRPSHQAHQCPTEPPFVMQIPLLCLSIPTVALGFGWVGNLLRDRFSVAILPTLKHDRGRVLAEHFEGAGDWVGNNLFTWPLWLALLGMLTAWLAYVRYPAIPAQMAKKAAWIFYALRHQLGFDALVARVLLPATQGVSILLGETIDRFVIDNIGVNGVLALICRSAKWVRKCQTGYLYHYAFMMITGLLILWVWMN